MGARRLGRADNDAAGIGDFTEFSKRGDLLPLSRAEQMFYCATKVETSLNGRPVQTGTGFFYVVHLAEDRTREVHLLVTNKHVLEGADRINLKLHQNDGKGSPVENSEFIDISLELNKEIVIHSPDSEVDLCAVAMGHALSTMHSLGKPIFYVALDKSVIPPSNEEWKKFDAIEKITMVGCPNGLFDAANNMPIARSGSTATDIARRYQGKNDFLIDLACFPGSSGSPVFVYDLNGGLDRGSTTFELGRIKSAFVGVLYAGPVMNNEGEIQLAKGPTFQFTSMMHLGLVVKSSEILIFEQIIRDMDAQGKL